MGGAPVGAPPGMENNSPMPPESQGIAPSAPSAGGMENNSPGGKKASPQQQDQYNVIVVQALELIHEKAPDQVLAKIEATGNPVIGVGATAADIVMGQVMSARGAGISLDRAAVLHAMKEVTGDLMETAEAAGLIPEIDPKMAQMAFMAAVESATRKAKDQGLVGPEDVERAKQTMSGPLPDGTPEPLQRMSEHLKGGQA